MSSHGDDIKTHPNDVLAGRGNGIKKHLGNVHFRNLVNAVKHYYVALPSSEKIKVSQIIIEAVKSLNPPGRFLKEIEHANGVSWEELTEKDALGKTSQALREGQPGIKQQGIRPMICASDIHLALFDAKVSCDNLSRLPACLYIRSKTMKSRCVISLFIFTTTRRNLSN